MYEDIVISRSPVEMGEDIADGLGWVEYGIGYGPWRSWRQPGVAIKKHQLQPTIYAYPGILDIEGLEWRVNWYMHDGHLDGVRITGWPDRDVLAQVFSLAIEPGIQDGYAREEARLSAEPGYRESLPGIKSTKRNNPKEYMIAEPARPAQS